MNWQNIFERLTWTFIQAAAATLVVGAIREGGIDLLESAFVSGCAAGLSFVKTYAQERLKELESR